MSSVPQTRIHKTDKSKGNFTQVCNELINNPKLSMKAKGIMLYILSKPSAWKVNETDIANHCKEGEKAIRSGIKELIEDGYMKRYPVRENNKIKEWVIEIFESGKQDQDEKLDADFLHVEEEEAPNRHYINNRINKDLKINNNNTPSLYNYKYIESKEMNEYIEKHFSKDIQDLLRSVERNTTSRHFNKTFLEAFEKAHSKTHSLPISHAERKQILKDCLYYMETNSVSDLVGLIISKMRHKRDQRLIYHLGNGKRNSS